MPQIHFEGFVNEIKVVQWNQDRQAWVVRIEPETSSRTDYEKVRSYHEKLHDFEYLGSEQPLKPISPCYFCQSPSHLRADCPYYEFLNKLEHSGAIYPKIVIASKEYIVRMKAHEMDN